MNFGSFITFLFEAIRKKGSEGSLYPCLIYRERSGTYFPSLHGLLLLEDQENSRASFLLPLLSSPFFFWLFLNELS